MGSYNVRFIVEIVLFDFAKAFDVISYHLLLGKSRLFGIWNPLIDWIEDFLIGRVMRVSGISDFMDVRSGVLFLNVRFCR